MNARTMTITKEIADHLLNYNTMNRSIRRSNVSYWIKCLKTGAVSLSHQGIAVTGDMQNPRRVIDGQHRLIAISETGIPMVQMFFENVPEEAFENLDNGVPRNMSDRTDISRSDIEICMSFFYYSITGSVKGNGRPSMLQVKKIHSLARQSIKENGTKKKVALSRASIRSAFVLGHHVFGKSHFIDFQEGNFDVLPSSLVMLYKRVLTTKDFVYGGGSNNASCFCLTWKALCNTERKRFNKPQSPISEACDVMRYCWPEVYNVSRCIED
jgi:hypothetical protein